MVLLFLFFFLNALCSAYPHRSVHLDIDLTLCLCRSFLERHFFTIVDFRHFYELQRSARPLLRLCRSLIKRSLMAIVEFLSFWQMFQRFVCFYMTNLMCLGRSRFERFLFTVIDFLRFNQLQCSA
ncbi:unnamed protein product [Haemonchus placei]|uniref:Secreted protein n=1 Tax=Haemonchus placei TaxID=6290 RepID=A0A3P7UQ10_HAEPC|nr:unnamed protein product [Haemonchus placei]